jgi:hypothetical protein
MDDTIVQACQVVVMIIAQFLLQQKFMKPEMSCCSLASSQPSSSQENFLMLN